MWKSSADSPPAKRATSSPLGAVIKPVSSTTASALTYLSPGLVVSLCRRDLITALVRAGCLHLAVKILSYVDSPSLSACALVCKEWHAILHGSMLATARFRRRVRAALFSGRAHHTSLDLSLEASTSSPRARAANGKTYIVDVTLDADSNLFALAVLCGRPQVLACSLFRHGRKRWVHRFTEPFADNAMPQCLAAGAWASPRVAVGLGDGRINVYDCSQQFRCLRLAMVLSHHTGAVLRIMFSGNCLVSCSDDMALAVVTRAAAATSSNANTGNNNIPSSVRLLQGHVSRVRCLDINSGRILTGSDDRSAKLWSLESGERPLATLTGHSGSVSALKLVLPLALTAANATVRLWDVERVVCLRVLLHDPDVMVTAVAWTSTFRGALTADAAGHVRVFDLHRQCDDGRLVVADCTTPLLDGCGDAAGRKCASSHVVRLDSVPHHVTALAVGHSPLPTLSIHCLDYTHPPPV